ncbi:hypothetical protein C8R41DRAFT_806319 [Lentinula lateritia]|uniref:Uncharacterized protein n=1 Tax=Lentinula lateritia TaxID=40482 RepID=A0ABQ8W1Z8_9AGAR|nr:hypothetical protein C8R41DRAFT_806319 [Lentinula lateritia]
MGVHSYNESPSPPAEQLARLGPPSILVNAGIPSIVWGEDALSIVHRVPTMLFDQHILVESTQLHAAAQAICGALPYSRKLVDERESWKDYSMTNKIKPYAFSFNDETLFLEHNNVQAAWEKDQPQHILLHDSSVFHIDAQDYSRTCLNPRPPSTEPAITDIRFPTLVAFFDAIIDTSNEPPLPFNHRKFESWLGTMMSYLSFYTVANTGGIFDIAEDGERLPIDACWPILEQVKEENRPRLIRNFIGRRLDPQNTRIEREDIKRDVCQHKGIAYYPSTRRILFDPYYADRNLPEHKFAPRLTPYISTNNDKRDLSWRPLARYTSIAAKLVRY